MSMTGDPNGPPMFVGLGIADQGSGVHAFAAIGYALFYREKTGIGQHIDISMVDALFHMHEVNVQAYGLTDGAFVPHRMGSHHQLICPCGAFKGPQGYIVVLVLDRQWAAMATAMGRPDLIERPALRHGRGARQESEGADPDNRGLDGRAGDRRGRAQDLRGASRCRAAPVMSVVGALDHPYFKARNMVRTVTDPILGELTITGFPLKFSEFPELPTIEAPLLGEHGGEVLKQYLGMSDAKVAELRAQACSSASGSNGRGERNCLFPVRQNPLLWVKKKHG